MPKPLSATPPTQAAPPPPTPNPLNQDSFIIDDAFANWYRKSDLARQFPDVASARAWWDLREQQRRRAAAQPTPPERGVAPAAPEGGTSGAYNPEFELWWKEHGTTKFGTDKELGRRWWEMRKAGTAGAGVAELGKLLTQARTV